MKSSDILIKKTLFYNLIIFDFILLESSSKKISNFFISKFKNQKFLISRISLFPVIKNFKRFIRLLNYLKNISYTNFISFKNKKKKNKKFQKSLKTDKKYNSINFFYFWVNTEETLDLFLLLFKQYKLLCFVHFNVFSPFFKSKFLLKTSLIFDQYITLNNYLSYFFKKIYLLQSFNSFQDSSYINTFKIFADLNDYKKLLFLGLIFISIFKK